MKIKFLFLFVLFCSYVSAQDILVTDTKESIRGKIVEITDNEVKYKKVGSDIVYTTSKNKILTIVLEGGEVLNFNSSKQPQQTEHTIKNSINNVVMSDGLNEDVEYLNSRNNYLSIQQYGNKSHVFLGNKKLNRTQLENILSDCPNALDKYNSSRRKNVGKWVTFGLGTSFALSTILFSALYAIEVSDAEYWGYQAPAPTGVIANCTAMLVCYGFTVGLSFKSSRLERESIQLYNEQCSNKSTSNIELGLGVNSKGLGIALRF